MELNWHLYDYECTQPLSKKTVAAHCMCVWLPLAATAIITFTIALIEEDRHAKNSKVKNSPDRKKRGKLNGKKEMRRQTKQ